MFEVVTRLLERMMDLKALSQGVVAVCCLLAAAAWADPPPKKPLYPPPEQSNSVGVLGAHKSSTGGTVHSAPPPAVAAPELPKVEAEQPEPLPAAPRAVVYGDHPNKGDAAAAITTVARTPNQYLATHPFVTGLLAGLVGTNLGTRLYGGTMIGDQGGTLIGYGLRVAVILAAAALMFLLVSRRALGKNRPMAPAPQRSEPSFGAAPPQPDGRREPTIGQPGQG